MCFSADMSAPSIFWSLLLHVWWEPLPQASNGGDKNFNLSASLVVFQGQIQTGYMELLSAALSRRWYESFQNCLEIKDAPSEWLERTQFLKGCWLSISEDPGLPRCSEWVSMRRMQALKSLLSVQAIYVIFLLYLTHSLSLLWLPLLNRLQQAFPTLLLFNRFHHFTKRERFNLTKCLSLCVPVNI